MTNDERRAYSSRYYQAHKEKAKEYQRNYNLTHKKKRHPSRGRAAKFVRPRVAAKTEYSVADLRQLSPEKLLRVLGRIASGEAVYPGVR